MVNNENLQHLEEEICALYTLMCRLGWLEVHSLSISLTAVSIYKGIPIQNDDLLDMLTGMALRRLSSLIHWEIVLHKSGTIFKHYPYMMTDTYNVYGSLTRALSHELSLVEYHDRN